MVCVPVRMSAFLNCNKNVFENRYNLVKYFRIREIGLFGNVADLVMLFDYPVDFQ